MDHSNRRTRYTEAVFKFQLSKDPVEARVISVWNLIPEVIQQDQQDTKKLSCGDSQDENHTTSTLIN